MNYIRYDGPLDAIKAITDRMARKAEEAAWPRVLRELGLDEVEMGKYQDRLRGIESRYDAVMVERRGWGVGKVL